MKIKDKIIRIKEIYDSKLSGDMKVNEACLALEINNIWEDDFTPRIAVELFYRYLIKNITIDKTISKQSLITKIKALQEEPTRAGIINIINSTKL
jgi:hypothetical protein